MGQLSHYYKAMIDRHEAVVITQPKRCDFCMRRGQVNEASYDGKTVMGPWANMCEMDFKEFGVGLGLGRGQKLLVQAYDPDERKKEKERNDG
jgi:hypothetical protein